MTKISIGIPVYNNLKDLKQCLDSISKFVTCKKELIIVDDKSRNKKIQNHIIQYSKENKKQFEKLIYIRNKKNMGFPHNANIILDKSENDVICILNSDTFVCPGAFEEVIQQINKDSKIMIAGPTTCKTNSIQEIYEFKKNRFIPPKEILKQAKSIKKRFKKKTLNLSQRETNSQIQGFCFFLKKKAIKKIGYFDEIYGLGTFEESDYNFRADLLGFKAIWVKHSYVHHFGQRSWKGINLIKILFTVSKNKKIWLNKIQKLNKENCMKVYRRETNFSEYIELI